MSEWTELPLGQVCEMTKGQSPTEKTPPGPYPLVVTAQNFRTADTYQFDDEAVCIPTISSTGHGHASLKRVHYASGRFALANLLVAAIVRPGIPLITTYLYHYLQHNKDSLIVPLMKGTANVNLKLSDLANLPVRFPGLNEQARLVALMESVEAAKATRQAEAAAALRLIPPLMESRIDPSASHVPVEDLLTVSIGGVWGQEAGGNEVDVSVLRSTEFTDHGFPSLQAPAIRSISAKQLSGRALRVGDLLLEKSGGGLKKPVGRVIRLQEDLPASVPSNFVQLLRPDHERVRPEYLHWILYSWHLAGVTKDYQAATTGIHNLRTKDYLQRPVPLPSLAEQQAIAADADASWVAFNKCTDSVEQADLLAEALLQRYLNGNFVMDDSTEVASA